MFKSILAAVDGSEESLASLKQAANLAKRTDAQLRVLYVEDERRFVEFPTYSDAEGSVPEPHPLPAEQLAQAEKQAEVEREAIKAAVAQILTGAGLPDTLEIVRGPINRTLIHRARGADLTVIGKRGRQHQMTEQAGPTTEEVIHEAYRPVLVVPDAPERDGPVLVAFDGSAGVQRVVVPGTMLAALQAAPMTVLTVSDDTRAAEEVQDEMRSYLAPYDVRADYRIEPGHGERETARRILALAEETGARMIVMGAFSRGPLREFFFGSATREVLARAPCPVLMMT